MRRATLIALVAAVSVGLAGLVALAAGPIGLVGPEVVSVAGATLHRSPAIAVDPADQSRLVADDIPAPGGACEASYSTDGGETWQAAGVQMPAGYPQCLGDAPMKLGFIEHRAIFVAEVGTPGGPGSELVALVSDDGGRSYTPAGTLASVSDRTSSAATQPSLATDPRHHRATVAYACGGIHPGGAAEAVCLVTTGDAGKSWTPVGQTACILCSPATDAATYVRWPQVTITASNATIVAWTGDSPAIDSTKQTISVSFRGQPSPPKEPLPGAASCGDACRLYSATITTGSATPASTNIIAPVADDPMANPTIAADPRNEHAFLAWHSVETGADGKAIQGVWVVQTQDGGASWQSREFRDTLTPLAAGDTTTDVVFPALSVTATGRVDIAFERMGRAAAAPNRYCYLYAQTASAGVCPTDVVYGFSDGDFTFNIVGVANQGAFDSLAGVGAGTHHAVGEHGAAVAGSESAAHPAWSQATTPSRRDTLADCFAYIDGLCRPIQVGLTAAPPPPQVQRPPDQPTLTLVYDHRYHLEGELDLQLPDEAARPARVITRVVLPPHPPLLPIVALLVASMLVNLTAAVFGARFAWAHRAAAARLLRRGKPGDA